MANYQGHRTHGTKGGKYKRKNYVSIDFNGFAEYAEELDKLGADLQKIFGDAMEEAGKTVQSDTLAALDSGNLPAQGKYSRGDTERAVIDDLTVQWSGAVGELPLGFNKSVPGAGGFLITGTPRMAPDYELEKIYGTRKYENQLKRSIEKRLQAEIDKRLGG